MSKHTIFRKFPSQLQANELKSLLEKNGIDSTVANNIPSLDATFSGSTLLHEYEVRIPQVDFELAEKILDKDTEDLLNEIPKDYYLFDFTDEELYEILQKRDEWNAFDYSLAQKILQKNGKSITQDYLAELKNERLSELSKPDENQKTLIIAGYIFAILGGAIGIIIGYSLWKSKNTLPNGKKVHSYNADDREHGLYIFVIGLIITFIAIIWRIYANVL